MRLLTRQVTPPSLSKKRGLGRPKKSGAAASDSQSAKSQTSDGNRKFPSRACKHSKRKKGILSDEVLERESSILKKAAKQRQEEVQTLLPFYRVQISILTTQPSSLIHTASCLPRLRPVFNLKVIAFESLLRVRTFILERRC